MKNILSKIGKSFLIPALAFSLSNKNVDAQKLEFSPVISVSSGITNYSKFKIYDDWAIHFKGLNGDEQLKNKKMEEYYDFQVGLNLGIKFNDLSLGLFSRYSITQVFNEIPLAAIELHNWNFNYARINEFFLKQTTPSIGAYIRFPISEKVGICLQGSAREANIIERKREDLYFAPDSKCPPSPVDNTDDLTQEFEKTKTKTLLNKIGLEVQVSDDNGRLGIEGFYETDWKRINILGLSGNIYFNLPEKKKKD